MKILSAFLFCCYNVQLSLSMVLELAEKSCGPHAAVLLGGKGGGYTETYSCDLPLATIGELCGLDAAVFMGQIVYCGGHLCHDDIDRWLSSMEIFDGNTWKLLPFTLRHSTNDHCLVPLSDTQVLLIGGLIDDHWVPSTGVEIYDIESGFVEELTSMPTPRWSHSCALFHGEVYVVGGANLQNRLNVVEIFNPFTRKWRTGPSMLNERADISMSVVDDYLMVFGGISRYSEGILYNTMEKFDGETWVEEPLQHSHAFHTSVTVSCLE